VFVADDFGNKLEFTADGQGQPKSLIAPGLEIKYRYNRLGRLDSVETVRASGQTETRLYHYEDPRDSKLLTGITDERGIRYATWTYDDQGRAISSEHAGGAEKILINYNADGSSTVTNELGKVARYQFQTIQGVRRITAIEGEPSANCPNSNSSFTYDERGLLKTKTDNKGHLTTYEYNERGLEVSRTEAAGTAQARTITTEWHPEFFLPTTVTEPTQITHYTYDTQGRQLSRTVTQR
jgi:YD repeat-containing protein